MTLPVANPVLPGRNCLDFVKASTYYYPFNFPGRFVGNFVRILLGVRV